jgi:hypothetical protein
VKRRALDEIATRQRSADQKREKEAELREQVAAASQISGDSISDRVRIDVSDPNQVFR